MGLCEKTCVPCKGGIPPLSREDAQNLVKQVPDWHLSETGTSISRKFLFKTFMEAMEFANRVAHLAEAEGHHPQITIGWGYCTVHYMTHKIKGLHENDFIMAAKTGALLGS